MKTSRATAALGMLCLLLLSGCHSLFEGDTTVLLPKQEKLLPTVDYVYQDTGKSGQFDSEMPAAFYIPEECADPLVSFECLDYREDSGEFVYAYQAFLATDDYLRYQEEKDAYEAQAQERESAYTQGILPAFETVQRRYHELVLIQKDTEKLLSNRAALDDYRAAVREYERGMLAAYQQKLQLYFDTYWENNAPAVSTTRGLTRYGVSAPLAPQQPLAPPSLREPVLTGDIRMVTRLAAYDYEAQQDRVLFEQVTGANSEQTMFARRLPKTGNYFIYFGGGAYFYLPNGRCFRQMDLSRCYKQMVNMIKTLRGTPKGVTILGVDVFENESRVILQTMVELKAIDENYDISEDEEEDADVQLGKDVLYFDLHYVMRALPSPRITGYHYGLDESPQDAVLMGNYVSYIPVRRLDAPSQLLDVRKFAVGDSLAGIGNPDLGLALGGFVRGVVPIHYGSDGEIYRKGDRLPKDVTLSEEIGRDLLMSRDSFYYICSIDTPPGDAWQKVALNGVYWTLYNGARSYRPLVYTSDSEHNYKTFGGGFPINHGSDILGVEALPARFLSFYPNGYAVFTENDIQICQSDYMSYVNGAMLAHNAQTTVIPLSDINAQGVGEESNPDTYRMSSIYILARNDFLIAGLNNGLVRYRPGNANKVQQLGTAPLFSLWRLADGSFIGAGFDTAGKRYTPEDMAKARVIRFRLPL